MQEENVCIYCRRQGSSKEHVAPASIGGNCIIHCVCKSCNEALSTIDKGLAEYSPVALSRIADTPASAFSTHLDSRSSFLTEELGRVDVRVSNQMEIEVRPQCFLDGNRLRFTVDGREALQEFDRFVTKQIAKGSLANTFLRIDPAQRLPHFSMTRSNQAVVTASSEEDGRLLLRTLEADWANIQAQLATVEEQPVSYPQPSVTTEMLLRPNDEFRAVAKIAFETLALLQGPHTVLEACFDPIREYIQGDVQLPLVSEGELSIDTRIVQRLEGQGHMQFTEQHAVLITSTTAGMVAHVTLYGQHRYVVKLSCLGSVRCSLQMYEFSPTRDGHQELDEFNIMKRMLQLGPEVLGLSKEEARKVLEKLNATRAKPTNEE